MLDIDLSLVGALFRAPETRVPFNTSNVFEHVLPASFSYIVVAVLVILPGTRLLRIAVWPLIALLAFHASTYVDFSNGNTQLSHLNVDFGLIMFAVSIRTLEWTFLKEPLNRHLRPANATPSILMDAFDLTANFRGVGWNWSQSVYIPRETRPTSSRLTFCVYVLLSAIAHSFFCSVLHSATQAFSPEAFTVLSGGTIFDPTLPPFIRYFRSSVITLLVGFGIYGVIQMNYDLGTLAGVAIFRQDPAQWPPVFDSPWLATSLRDFWGRRWHQLFRRTFVVLGGWPLGLIFGRLGYILGSFLASGIVHHIVVLLLNGRVEVWWMPVSFGMMAVGVILEHWFTLVTGRKVGGWLGRLWTTGWLLVWSSMMVDGFGRAGMFASSIMFDCAAPVRGIVEQYAMAFDRLLHTYAL
ncbi:hypothetical protein ID866_8993 [Astraeus odoratus]|nr:hypothetical protein ID866_8993 [Astraeus odoratus]